MHLMIEKCIQNVRKRANNINDGKHTHTHIHPRKEFIKCFYFKISNEIFVFKSSETIQSSLTKDKETIQKKKTFSFQPKKLQKNNNNNKPKKYIYIHIYFCIKRKKNYREQK